ncbi:uncharacterized protein Eint_071420 [Encephalitozoon intestinalis ATCC 50506]|uniref:Uncharacterized protein n=1 Tax=Encephalitozoon intestinalis (strain ATCC 50506) TaxID=876142 RepID=E0S870_ENCIT|nr:uncharacterized protein Eint_071420 [Encephalitozoon intestinalis ATCC 50506]ADM11905.2 hypothetical protein Eint_071420 [Encephalitozoon intestinalis ATCC 50506]UTX45661.1 hypothetical protein GPK93_07g12260 [Encephalitozoon intestinalis]
MNLLWAGYVFGKMITHEVERVLERPSEMEPLKTISNGMSSLHLYLQETEGDVYEPAFSQLVQRLKNIPDFVMEQGDKIYRIVPFESIEIDSPGGKKNHGKFHEIASMGNEVVMTYTSSGRDGEEGMYTTITVIFTSSDGEEKIEKIYSGWSESCLLRVSTPKLKVKHRKRILSMYLEDLESKDPKEEAIGHWIEGVNSEGKGFNNDAILKEEMMIFEEAGRKDSGDSVKKAD